MLLQFAAAGIAGACPWLQRGSAAAEQGWLALVEPHLDDPEHLERGFDRTMAESRWFGKVMLEVSPPSHFAVLDALEDLLTTLQPSQLDRERSYAIDGEFFLAHRADVLGDVEVRAGSGSATIYAGVAPPAEVYTLEAGGDVVDWVADLIEELTEILTDNYRVETWCWGDRHVRTVVHGRNKLVIGRFLSLLPIPHRLLARRTRELTYGCYVARE